MARQVQLRRGTAAQHSSFTGAAGEVTVDTDDDRLVVHDGATAGGIPQAKESEVLKQGSHVIGCWGARALVHPTTSPAGDLAQKESTTNDVNDEYVPFDAASTEYMGFSFRAPEGLDESSGLDIEIEWSENSGASSHVCRWGAQAQAQGDGDTIDSAWGTAVEANDTGTSGTRRFVTLSSVTPAGSWAAGDKIHVRVYRQAVAAADTLDVDAHLHGVTVKATVNAATDA